jgi:transcriptional regulator with XRE-family HTH domain
VPQRSHASASFGRKLKKLRVTRGLSQERLALEAGINRTYLGGMERGEKNPSLLKIVAVAGVLEVPVTELVSEVQAPEPDTPP